MTESQDHECPLEPELGSAEGELTPGMELAGKYEVERILGRGGMGTVVAVRHLELDELFALKLMRVNDPKDSAEMLARFRREARVSAKVRHERVMRVFDVARLQDGTPYMVMELLEGEDLGSTLERRGRLDPVEAVDVALQICEGLAAIHAAGVVHRDLKPENVFIEVRRDGTSGLKILDFGIAKLDDAALGDEARHLTVTAGAMGTPPYMAPEQVTAPETADARADIWAMGTVLYALLTGENAFSSADQHDSMLHILTLTPSAVHTVQADVPPALGAVVARCMEKERGARFSDVAELARALVPLGSPGSSAALERIERTLAPHGQAGAGRPRAGRRPATLTPLTSANHGSGDMAARPKASVPLSIRPLVAMGGLAALLTLGALLALTVVGSNETAPEPQSRSASPLPQRSQHTEIPAPPLESSVAAPTSIQAVTVTPDAAPAPPARSGSGAATKRPSHRSLSPAPPQPSSSAAPPPPPSRPAPAKPPASEDLFDDRK